MIVVLIIAILLAISVPNFLKARSRSQQRTCVSNLRQLDAAKETYAFENNLTSGAVVVSANIWPEYIKGQFPVCPSGGTYSINPVGTEPLCSIGAPLPHAVGQ
jgi:competence protein ComGC